MSPMRPKSGKPSFCINHNLFSKSMYVSMNPIISLVEICGYCSYFSERVLFKTIIKEKLSESDYNQKSPEQN